MSVPLLPLFPLQSVLFPGGHLALRIFEPRYLDMIGRCHRNGEPFGVVGLTEGSEVRRLDPAAAGGFQREAFEAVGTLAHIEHFERPQPGLMQIRCRGGRRFRLTRSECLSHGLWVGEPVWIEDDAAVPVPDDLRQAVRLLQGLLHKLEMGASASEMPVQPPYRWDDAGWLSNRWAELLPLRSGERQRLMQLDNPLLRLELVVDQLDRFGSPDA